MGKSQGDAGGELKGWGCLCGALNQSLSSPSTNLESGKASVEDLGLKDVRKWSWNTFGRGGRAALPVGEEGLFIGGGGNLTVGLGF